MSTTDQGSGRCMDVAVRRTLVAIRLVYVRETGSLEPSDDDELSLIDAGHRRRRDMTYLRTNSIPTTTGSSCATKDELDCRMEGLISENPAWTCPSGPLHVSTSLIQNQNMALSLTCPIVIEVLLLPSIPIRG